MSDIPLFDLTAYGKFRLAYDNFANKAGFGVTVHRDLKTGRTTISVRKCRFKHLGQIGEAELEYDLPTGCYRPFRKTGLS